MVFYCFFSECLCTVVRAAPCMLCLCELTLNCILQLLFLPFGSDMCVCVCSASVLYCQSSTLFSSV